jgi:DNA polymerase I-like protein with 3'-5' exonuclease and polymerase domains
MTRVLADIEYNGLRINLDTLDKIRKQYQEEMDGLEVKLVELAREAMGDTPINLASPDDRSMLLYSRKVKDKSLWSQVFNLGH